MHEWDYPPIFGVFNSPPPPPGADGPPGGGGTSADSVPTKIKFGVDPSTQRHIRNQSTPACKLWRESARGLSRNRWPNKKTYSKTNTSPFALTSEWRIKTLGQDVLWQKMKSWLGKDTDHNTSAISLTLSIFALCICLRLSKYDFM